MAAIKRVERTALSSFVMGNCISGAKEEDIPPKGISLKRAKWKFFCHGNYETLKNEIDGFIQRGAEIDFLFGDILHIKTPLTYAILERDEMMARALIENGADIEKTCPYHVGPDLFIRTLITLCNYPSDIEAREIVHLMLELGVNPNSKHGHLGYPLCLAAIAGNINLFALLLKHGADINVALLRASRLDNLDVVKFLLDRGADIESVDQEDNTVLHKTVLRSRLSLSAIKEFIDRGVHINAINSKGETALYVGLKELSTYFWRPIPSSLTTKLEATIKTLIKHGADINAEDKMGGQTVLRECIENKNMRAAKKLIDFGVELNDESLVLLDEMRSGVFDTNHPHRMRAGELIDVDFHKDFVGYVDGVSSKRQVAETFATFQELVIGRGGSQGMCL